MTDLVTVCAYICVRISFTNAVRPASGFFEYFGTLSLLYDCVHRILSNGINSLFWSISNLLVSIIKLKKFYILISDY